MTEHPIVLSPDLRRFWFDEAQRKYPDNPSAWVEYFAEKASRWGADQELEACCEVMRVNGDYVSDGVLRAIRRPLSDKEQALRALSLIMSRQKGIYDGKPFETVRKVLEAL